MTIVLCPGMHAEAATAAFVRSLELPSAPLIFPAHAQPPYSPEHLLTWLRSDSLGALKAPQGLCVVAFSAGVVGALGAARVLWRDGVSIRAFIALDGWGVPLQEPFPIYRLSHDQFTHQTSLLLGPKQGQHFYADPAVDHLTLWRSPQCVSGWQIDQGPSGQPPNRDRTTAAAFLELLLHRYTRPVREPVQP